MIVPSVDTLAHHLCAHQWIDAPPLPGRSNHLEAGVLVPLLKEGGDWLTTLTLRPTTLTLHAGEVCFPGGRREPQDADLWATAEREASEELGVEVIRRICRISSVPLYTSDYRLVPHVAVIGPKLDPEPGEVSRVLKVSLRACFEAPFVDAIPFDWGGDLVHSPVFVFDGVVTFGGTAHVLYELLRVVAPAFEAQLPPFRTGLFHWSQGAVRPLTETS